MSTAVKHEKTQPVDINSGLKFVTEQSVDFQLMGQINTLLQVIILKHNSRKQAAYNFFTKYLQSEKVIDDIYEKAEAEFAPDQDLYKTGKGREIP